MTTASPPRFGVLLPHFGPHASRERLIDSSVQIEKYGFDAVWVRDHVVFEPHSYEDPDRTHVDPLVVLSAVGAVTTSLTLGTATLIPHRHPIHAALALGSLDFIAGPDRLIVGMGLGTAGHEFDSIGMPNVDRTVLMREQVEIMRKLWTGESISFEGEIYSFTDVRIKPVPASGTIPIWYGGNSFAAARRSVEYCDGWLPARMPRFALKKRLRRIDDLIEANPRPRPVIGMVPYVVPGETVEKASLRVNTDEYFPMLSKSYGPPPGKEAYESIEDLDGSAIVGPPELIAEQVTEFLCMGVEHFVFDLRVSFDTWEESLAVIGEEVLPLLKGQS
jgi:probable F420-dependent oxidoreductase